jgi:DNA-directed RNA polymerase specialized sigma24 family protein
MRAHAINRVSEPLATSDEVAEALGALSKSDIARLNAIARFRARSAPGLDWRDLLHEAIERALDGTRKWPRNLPLLFFLREVMRSLASEHLRKVVQGPICSEADLPIGNSESPLLTAASEEANPEREAVARNMISSIMKIFAEDSEVLAVIDGIALGLSPGEIQTGSNMTAIEYASAQRRIRRGLARAFPEGSEI